MTDDDRIEFAAKIAERAIRGVAATFSEADPDAEFTCAEITRMLYEVAATVRSEIEQGGRRAS
jgi:hypothetical protein